MLPPNCWLRKGKVEGLFYKILPLFFKFHQTLWNDCQIYQILPNFTKNLPNFTKWKSKSVIYAILSQFQIVEIYASFPSNLYPQRVRVDKKLFFFQLCWSCDLRANERPRKQLHPMVHTDTQTHRQMDIATLWMNLLVL